MPWLAREGAGVILVDIGRPVETVAYPGAIAADLAETARLVGELGRKPLTVTADVCRQEEFDDAVARGLAEFGRIVLTANAGSGQ
jgi:NAD(P)-dependent dehydrogenase (short-subunit alcohol dehydrogenase family)